MWNKKNSVKTTDRKLRKRSQLSLRSINRRALVIMGAVGLVIIAVALISVFWGGGEPLVQVPHYVRQENLPILNIQKKLLAKNKYSRPGTELEKVKGVVVHYTANPGSDAIDNRNYFNNLPEINKSSKKKKPIYASSHFVVGLEGQIIQCVPLSEIAYASNERNEDTISIECCHPDKTGKFNRATEKALEELLVYLCLKFGLDGEDIIRHYDVTGKLCPLYFVEHEDEWLAFRENVDAKLKMARSS